MKTAIHHLFVNVSEICRSISFLMWMIFIILYKSRGSCGVGVGRQSGAGQGLFRVRLGDMSWSPSPLPGPPTFAASVAHLSSRAHGTPGPARRGAGAGSAEVGVPSPHRRARHEPSESGSDGAEHSAASCLLFHCFSYMCKQKPSREVPDRCRPSPPHVPQSGPQTPTAPPEPGEVRAWAGTGQVAFRLFKLHLVAKKLVVL